MSRLKRWSLVKVVKANTLPQVKVEGAVNP
jgi:hypothetical protein